MNSSAFCLFIADPSRSSVLSSKQQQQKSRSLVPVSMAACASEGPPRQKQRTEAEHPAVGDTPRPLPGDVLEDIFRRLVPRRVAACRSVCRAWRAVVDGRRLLREDLLPLKLGGIFFCFIDHDYPDFLARPSATPTIAGWPDTLPTVEWWSDIEDHCNGLIMSDDMVVNPTTRRWVRLPWDSCGRDKVYHDFELMQLAYDPTISPHYAVISFPCFHDDREIELLLSRKRNNYWFDPQPNP